MNKPFVFIQINKKTGKIILQKETLEKAIAASEGNYYIYSDSGLSKVGKTFHKNSLIYAANKETGKTPIEYFKENIISENSCTIDVNAIFIPVSQGTLIILDKDGTNILAETCVIQKALRDAFYACICMASTYDFHAKNSYCTKFHNILKLETSYSMNAAKETGINQPKFGLLFQLANRLEIDNKEVTELEMIKYFDAKDPEFKLKERCLDIKIDFVPEIDKNLTTVRSTWDYDKFKETAYGKKIAESLDRILNNPKRFDCIGQMLDKSNFMCFIQNILDSIRIDQLSKVKDKMKESTKICVKRICHEAKLTIRNALNSEIYICEITKTKEELKEKLDNLLKNEIEKTKDKLKIYNELFKEYVDKKLKRLIKKTSDFNQYFAHLEICQLKDKYEKQALLTQKYKEELDVKTHESYELNLRYALKSQELSVLTEKISEISCKIKNKQTKLNLAKEKLKQIPELKSRIERIFDSACFTCCEHLCCKNKEILRDNIRGHCVNALEILGKLTKN